MNQKAKSCPNCKNHCHNVSDTTMRHHLRFPSSMEKLSDTHHYCNNHDCDLAYFSPTCHYSVAQLQTSTQIQQRTICFCFGITEDTFRKYQQQNNENKFFEDLDQLAYSSECFCRVKNPAGRGCLKIFKAYLTDEV